MCQEACVSGASDTQLPTTTMWRNIYNKDAKMCFIRDMIMSPSTITQANRAKINFDYRSLLRNLHLVLENNTIDL